MPFVSKKQAAFAHANPDKFGGQAGLKEWDSATNFGTLPEKKKKRKSVSSVELERLAGTRKK